MSYTAKLKFQMANGKEGSVEANENIYRFAANNRQSVRQYLNTMAEEAAHEQGSYVDTSYGQAFDQAAAASGMFSTDLTDRGRVTMADLFRSELRKPAEQTDDSLGARLLYPQIVLDALQFRTTEEARANDLANQIQSMTATTRNVNGELVQQPTIDVTGPEGSEDGRIAQLATPPTMVSITTGQRAYSIPTYSIGLTISDQALEATTLDLVTLIMQRQAAGQRVRQLTNQMNGLIVGDPNMEMRPLEETPISQFTGGGTTIDKKTWYKILRSNRYMYSYSHALSTLDALFDIDDALAPTVIGADGTRIATPYRAPSFDINQPTMVDFEADVLGSAAGKLILLDSRYAIQRTVNVSASYEDAEDFVLRRGKAFRVDHGEMLGRLDDEAWLAIDLNR